MKVKVGNKIYSDEDQPIMIILTNQDKAFISTMGEQTKYCCYPQNISTEKIKKFMENPDDQKS